MASFCCWKAHLCYGGVGVGGGDFEEAGGRVCCDDTVELG